VKATTGICMLTDYFVAKKHQQGVTDLLKSGTWQVVAGRPSHVASQPWSSASTDLQFQIPLYHLLESVIAKPARGFGRRAGHPLGPLVSVLCKLPPRLRYTLGVTLILVEWNS
jgi:hypothetical protein